MSNPTPESKAALELERPGCGWDWNRLLSAALDLRENGRTGPWKDQAWRWSPSAHYWPYVENPEGFLGLAIQVARAGGFETDVVIVRDATTYYILPRSETSASDI